MFYKHYRIKVGGEEHEIVYAAMIGENPHTLKRTVFYTSVDYSTEPAFNDEVHYKKAKEWLIGELKDYGYIPFPDTTDIILPDIEKKLKRALKKNRKERIQLMNKLKLVKK